jgi:hypothetical protein
MDEFKVGDAVEIARTLVNGEVVTWKPGKVTAIHPARVNFTGDPVPYDVDADDGCITQTPAKFMRRRIEVGEAVEYCNPVLVRWLDGRVVEAGKDEGLLVYRVKGRGTNYYGVWVFSHEIRRPAPTDNQD